MADTRKTAVAVVGIDIGNIVRLDERGAIALRQIAARPVGITICHRAALPRRHEGLRQRAHHVSRRFRALGHDARLTPPKYVRPYSEEQNNDFRDAHAIAEAVQRCAECVCGAEPFQKLLCLMADYADCRTEILMITAIRNTLVHRVSLIHAMG